MIDRILLDIDGVLNEFALYVMQRMGLPIAPGEYEKYPTDCGWEIVDAAHRLGWVGDNDEFWGAITREMWESTPKSDICDWLVETSAGLVGHKNVCILTSPAQDPDSAAAKVTWVKNNLPKWIRRQFLVGPAKHFCAGPRCLLVDDSDKNVDRFRAAGGSALLVPRPWNRLHGVDTQAYLIEAFDLYHRLEDLDETVGVAL